MIFARITFWGVGWLGCVGMCISTTSHLDLFVASSLLTAVSTVLTGLCD
jgi:energy-converting hydrogenase Eha subunit C